MRIAAEYVVPLKAAAPDAALAEYLNVVVDTVAVTVVDGSSADTRAEHRRLLDERVRLVAPEPRPGRNGKVAGVMTGVRTARHPLIVIADDDVRYASDSLREVVSALAESDVVAPQNHLVPPVWHTRRGTARTLQNRAIGTDYPGTFGLRRDTLLDGRFLGQRVRQAYDDFAQPARLAAEPSLPPLAALLRRRAVLRPFAAVLLAEVGRRRHDGRSVFAPTAALWPCWLVEHGVRVWLALGLRLSSGVPYAGSRLVRAATPPRILERRIGCH